MRVYRQKEHASRIAFAMLLFGAVLVSTCLSPAIAYAKFNEVASSFPAMQDLGTYDDPIKGSQLPDGNYRVTARTSSSMCIFYTNPADAEARDSKEQAILTVTNGNMVALFYTSRAYNYLYMGTQEQAAAATNAEGTDASQYMAGDPPEGYVPHLFAMNVSTLNTPITFSSYSGGNNGNEGGVWYTRQVVFGMSAAEYERIIMESRQQDQPDQQEQEPEKEPAQKSEQTQSSQQGQQVNLNPDNVNNEGNTTEQNSESSQQVDQENEKRGVKMTGVNPGIDVDIEASAQDDQADEEGFRLTTGQITALVLAGLLAAGIVVRVISFRARCDRAPRESSDSKVEEGSDEAP